MPSSTGSYADLHYRQEHMLDIELAAGPKPGHNEEEEGQAQVNDGHLPKTLKEMLPSFGA